MFKVTQLVNDKAENLTQNILSVAHFLDRLTESSLSLILKTIVKE